MSYVIKYKGKYARFGSYGSMALVDSPEGATIYSKLKDAQKRMEGRNGCFYYKHNPISIAKLAIYEIDFSYTEKKV